ncbi:cellulose biosynthesis cyclic di-GMP-binding regulatory protein BcsB [Sulfurihydrogenibium azorense]|uniref:cellulose biosynthesis cyclic di-GMP-binding regulatory protein BcsB n=1 Tax=Sulfurihydrogenibium azorense TaxID=309806 RepID=UPI00391B6EDA
MKKKVTIVYLVWLSFFTFLINSAYGKEIVVPLKDIAFQNPMLRSIEAEYTVKIPIPSRYLVKNLFLHLEVEKSRALVKERSSIALFFNNKLVLQKPFDPLLDIMIIETNLPTVNLGPFNDLKISAIHHYCLNCCEFEGSPELWSKLDLENSYIKITYDEKPILEDTLLIRDYVLDQKLFNPINVGIITENKEDSYLSLAARLAGYIGSYLRYRRAKIDYLNKIPEDKDVFIIGSKSFVKQILNLQDERRIPDIAVYPNPFDITKAVVVITGNSYDRILKSLNSFMSVKENVYTGKDYNILNIKQADLSIYNTAIFIPLGKKVYLSELGYDDFKFKGIYPPPAVVEFRIPQGLYIQKNKKIKFHFAYNYGAGAREDSVINIYLNDKYITSLKMEKKYGTVMEEKDIDIPAYLLQQGLNKLKIEYAMMAPGGGFCISPNIEALRGTFFTSKSYIEIPKMPYWFEMPYLEYFVDSGFPYSMQADLSDTVFLINEKNDTIISSLLTLSSYLGSRSLSPYVNLRVYSYINEDVKSKHIIYVGRSIPLELQSKSPIKITENIDLSVPIFKSIFNGSFLKKLKKDKSNIANLNYLNTLTNQVFFIMFQSPYDSQKVVTVLYSPNLNGIEKASYMLYIPKFAGQVKGDIAIWDFYVNQFFSDNISEKFYIGNLPFFERLIFELGFSPMKLALAAVILTIILSLVVKKILDYREKRRLDGEI